MALVLRTGCGKRHPYGQPAGETACPTTEDQQFVGPGGTGIQPVGAFFRILLPRRWMMVLPLLAAAQAPVPQEARLSGVPYLPRPAATIRAETNLVDIGVVVRDSRGHAVPGLNKSDFEVRDEGKPRDISAFSVEQFAPAVPAAGHAQVAGASAPAPSPSAAATRWVAMVFDDIATPFENLNNAKAAAKRFLKDGLAANDRVGVFTTSAGMVLPFTADAAKVAAAIDSVKFRDRQVRSGSCPLLTEYDSYRIANNLDPMALALKAQEYGRCSQICPSSGSGKKRGEGPFPTPCDAAMSYVQHLSKTLWEQIRMNSQASYAALEDVVNFMSHLPGTRVMLLASSGFVSGTLESEENRVAEKALRANVVINSLDAKGLYTGDFEVGEGAGPRSIARQQQSALDGKSELNDVMGNLADATGGLFFHNNNDLDQGFHELGMQPGTRYLLAVAPETLDGKYHHLKVSLTQSGHFTVQARKGYVASPEKPAQHDAAEPRRMDAEVFSATLLNDAPVTVSANPEKSPDGRPMARLTFHVDIARAQFHVQEGVHAQRYRMIAALFNAEGSYAGGIEGVLDLALQEATYQRVLKNGFNADLRMAVAAGSYRLRTVVVEGDDKGRYSTATQAVEFK